MTITLTFAADATLKDVISEPVYLTPGMPHTITVTADKWPEAGGTLYWERKDPLTGKYTTLGTYTEATAVATFPLGPTAAWYRARMTVTATATGDEVVYVAINQLLTNVTAVMKDEDGNILIGRCLTAYLPADDTPGCAAGCLMITPDGTTVAKVYCNIGTAAACNFNLVTVEADAG